MSNGSFLIPLSGGPSGAPIDLDNAAAPGKLIHANPADSGGNDLVQNILIGNPNPNQITLEVQTQGPGVTTPRPIRIDVPPTAEGFDVRLFYTPFLLAPGSSYFVATELQQGNVSPYLYGYVERYAAASFDGYGGLVTTATVAMADILAGAWATVPFAETRPGVPVNVTTDPGGNQLAIDVPGVWAVSVYVTLEFARDQTNDRILYLRFWNATDGVAVSDSPFPLYIEQGSTGGTWSIPTAPVDVVQDLVGKQLQIQIGGAALDFTGIQVDKAGFNVHLVDPVL